MEKSYILRFWLFACSFRLFAYSFGQDFGLRLGCFGCFGCLVVCLNSLVFNIYCLCVFGPSNSCFACGCISFGCFGRINNIFGCFGRAGNISDSFNIKGILALIQPATCLILSASKICLFTTGIPPRGPPARVPRVLKSASGFPAVPGYPSASQNTLTPGRALGLSWWPLEVFAPTDPQG